MPRSGWRPPTICAYAAFRCMLHIRPFVARPDTDGGGSMRAWAFAAVALLFTAAGCGGDDTSDPGRGGSGGIIGVGGSGGGTGGDGGTGGVGGSGGTGGSGGSGGVPGPVCGDGVIEGDEECDGTNLAGKSCVDFEGFLGGTLGCTD